MVVATMVTTMRTTDDYDDGHDGDDATESVRLTSFRAAVFVATHVSIILALLTLEGLPERESGCDATMYTKYSVSFCKFVRIVMKI